ncbi:MAG: Fic family protein [Variibacter sp.]
MIVFELTTNEQDPTYQALEISNGNRHYDFLHSIIGTSLALGRPFLSQQIIKALNFHAIACLHIRAGEYRPCDVTAGQHNPPAHFRVQALMDDFVNIVNRHWQEADAVALATYVLWRLNNIHPFINGNGRTARASCYYVLCVKAGGLLPGTTILPELIRQNHNEYVSALQKGHDSGGQDLADLHALVGRLLDEQLKSAQHQPPAHEPQLPRPAQIAADAAADAPPAA